MFAPVLVPLLEKVHGQAVHIGKAPSRLAGRKARQEILDLEAELEDAIAREDYEIAAQLRDRIRSQSAGGDSSASSEPEAGEDA